MPDPTLEELLFRKAQSIGPQPQNALGQDLPLREGEDYPSQVVEFLKGLGGFGEGHQGSNALGQVLGLAGVPFFGKISRGTSGLGHTLEDIQNIANRTGDIRLYHGTTADNAAKILSEQAIKLPASGEAAAQAVAKRYGIPWSEWKARIEPEGVGAGYGSETKRLSTAPFDIASRWATGSRQGEVDSMLNQKARMWTEAKKQGVAPKDFDEFYNKSADIADSKGIHNMYKIPDAINAEDRMAPKLPGGAIFQITADARALPKSAVLEAQMMLRAIEKGEISPEDAVKFWNNTYQDIKIHPQNVKRMEQIVPPQQNGLDTDIVSRMKRAEEMGFNMDVYHGTRPQYMTHGINGEKGITTISPGAKFTEFEYKRPFGDAGIHVDPDPHVANVATATMVTPGPGGTRKEPRVYGHGAAIMPLKARIQNPLELPDMGLWSNPRSVEQVLRTSNVPDTPVVRELLQRASTYQAGPNYITTPEIEQANNARWSEEMKNILKRHGYDSVKYPNTSEGHGGPSYMLLDPNQLRSRFAAFDPARAKSGDLLASLLAAVGLGTAASQDDK